MNGQNDNHDEHVESGEAPEPADSTEEETIVLDTDDMDNVGDMSVEINVDELVAKIEANDDGESAERLEARRKLDALEEQRKTKEDLGDTYNINLDDELE